MFDHPVVGTHIPPPRAADQSRPAWFPFMAWQWLVKEAAWKARTLFIAGKEIQLERGEICHAQSFMAEAWNWGRKAVRVFIEHLKSAGMLTDSVRFKEGQTKGHTKGHTPNVLNICNYDKYQSEGGERGQQEGQQGASQGPARGHKQYKDTKESTLPPARERDEIDQVKVNGTAIYGPGFTIDLGAVDMAAALTGIPQADARQLAEVCARDWAANGTKPPAPMATVKRALAEELIRRRTNDARAGQSAAGRPQWRQEHDDKVARMKATNARISAEIAAQKAKASS
jgi:hypothetical protein